MVSAFAPGTIVLLGFVLLMGLVWLSLVRGMRALLFRTVDGPVEEKAVHKQLEVVAPRVTERVRRVLRPMALTATLVPLESGAVVGRIDDSYVDDLHYLVLAAMEFFDEYAAGLPYTPKKDAEQLAFIVDLTVDKGGAFLAEKLVDGVWRPVGMLGIIVGPHPMTGEKYAEEVAWWVEPEHRGGKLGRLLFDAAERFAMTAGCVVLKMTAPTDSPAALVYRRRGYVAVETAYFKKL